MTPCNRRPGALNGTWLAFLGSLVLFGVLVGLLLWPSRDAPQTQGPIVIYCAAGIKPAVEAIAKEYEQKYGVEVRPDYGGSQALLSRLIESGPDSAAADLFLPADEEYIRIGRAKKLLAETIPLAHMHPVVAVAAGNPKKIASIDDLLRPEIHLAQANPDVAAIGKVTRDALRKSGQWDALNRRVTVSETTVNAVGNAVQLKSVDAGFVWDATVRQMPQLEAVELPQFAGISSEVSVAVMAGSRHPTAALRFARYLAARDRGLPLFTKNGFDVVDGDDWAEKPRLLLYAGAMLRPAVERTIEEFKQREGVEVVTNYNGCGILVAGMKGGERPDAYFACDKSFMDQVADLFADNQEISTNRLVIVVRKGNPHGIHSLDDLGQPGLRLGVGNEKQCALGALTQKALEQGGARDRAMKNVVAQTPAGDMLITHMRGGALDAVVAYLSNASGYEDELETIPVDLPCALAVQPIAVGRDSKHKQLTERLVSAIRSAESKERFESKGFQWRASAPSPLPGVPGRGVGGEGQKPTPSPPTPLPRGARGDKQP